MKQIAFKADTALEAARKQYLKIMPPEKAGEPPTEARGERQTAGETLLQRSIRKEATAQVLRRFADVAAGLYVCDAHSGELLLINQPFADAPEDALDARNAPRMWEELDEAGGRWLRYVAQTAQWPDGRVVDVVTFADITQEKERAERLHRLAYHDDALQLPNMAQLQGRLAQMDCMGCYMVLLDIEAFRDINQTYGRSVGDGVLRAVAADLAQRVQGGEVYRVEGDSFCALLTGSDMQHAGELAREIRLRFEAPWQIQTGGQLNVYCKAKLAIIEGAAFKRSGQGLISAMAYALERAKQRGDTAVFNQALGEEMAEQEKLLASLARSVANGMAGFEVYYQPVVDPAKGTWKGLETLCRWNSPVYGSISPDVFIPLAEGAALIGRVGRWVLRSALRQCAAWGLEKIEGFRLGVKVSPLELADEGYAQRVLTDVQETGFAVDKLVLQLPRRDGLAFEAQAISALGELRSAGIAVAWDNYAGGESGFEKLPLDYLKTGGELLRSAGEHARGRRLFCMAAEFARADGLQIVASGIETPQHMALALSCGADYLQGNLLGEAQHSSAVAQQLYRFILPQQLARQGADNQGAQGGEGAGR